MNYALRIVAFVCALTTFSVAGVTVYDPTSGSQDSSPVHFVASASGNYPIIAMKVYSDNNVAYSVDASSIEAQVVSVALNGHKSYINRSFNTYSVRASALNAAVQLDGDYNQQDYSMWVDKMQVTAW